MYPNLYYFFRDLFGVDWPFLKAVNSLGFFMALAFLPAAWLWKKEYERRESIGQLRPREITITIGKPAGTAELLLHFFLGFITGFKLLGVFLIKDAASHARQFIFSVQGHWPAGIVIGCLWAGYTWWQGQKQKLPVPEKHTFKEWPHQLVLRNTIIAAIAGVAGSKLFGILENWRGFIDYPLATLVSPSGFAYYGGLISVILILYPLHRPWKSQRIYMSDGVAPSLMLGYALGRIGCQVAGDGDWGIANTRPKPLSWLPDWLWAYDYPHNINQEGVLIPGCDWDVYCYHLAVPVYPTPVYELILCLACFAVLMYMRKKFTVAGRLAGLYLMLTGIERFLIEKIRINLKYSIFGFHPTQAEIVSVCIFIAGFCLYLFAPKLNANKSGIT